jgi:hypothetical protein
MFVCEGVTQQGLRYICLLRNCCLAADDIWVFVSWLLPSNGTTYYNIYTHIQPSMRAISHILIIRHLIFNLLHLGRILCRIECAETNFYKSSLPESAGIGHWTFHCDGQCDVFMWAHINMLTRKYLVSYLRKKSFDVSNLKSIFKIFVRR